MCRFCSKDIDRDKLLSTKHFYAIRDRAPVTEGHTLLIPKRHFDNILQLSDEEAVDLHHARRELVFKLQATYRPDGFNFGSNYGAAAGQTVFHFHEHVITRTLGDAKDPKGGVRNLMTPLQQLWPEE